jgi:hypothetical protein
VYFFAHLILLSGVLACGIWTGPLDNGDQYTGIKEENQAVKKMTDTRKDGPLLINNNIPILICIYLTSIRKGVPMIRKHVSISSGQVTDYFSVRYSLRACITVLLLMLIALVMSYGSGSVYALSTKPYASRAIWLQVMDSCQQAIPGASFKLTGNGLASEQGPASGTRHQTVTPTYGNCPLQRGNCARVSTGCLTWDIPVPSQGAATYQITETSAPHNYIPCTGGSVCSGGPVTGTLTINSTGSVAATVHNVFPDRTSVIWPTNGDPYTATRTDPIIVHNFQLGNGSCDGDNDADDHLTGSPSSHCDSDGD